MNQEGLFPTNLKSSLPQLPSLDEMLHGGILGNWLLTGVTSIGKTTLATHMLSEEEDKGAGIIDFGTRQSQERYAKNYGKEVIDLKEIVSADQELIVQNIQRLINEYNESKKTADCEAHVKNSGALMYLSKIYDKATFTLFREKPKIKPQKKRLRLGKSSENKIVKVNLHPRERITDIENYFGKSKFEDELDYQYQVLSAFLYHTLKINETKKYLIDGITLENSNTEKELIIPDSTIKAKEVVHVWNYFNGRNSLIVPYLGTNEDKITNFTSRVYWNIQEPTVTLTSIALTRTDNNEIISDINDAINATESLPMAPEADGIIVLGKNTRREYAFLEESSKAAPPDTRILALRKSRYGIDETLREIIIDAKDKKPKLGRVMVYKS